VKRFNRQCYEVFSKPYASPTIFINTLFFNDNYLQHARTRRAAACDAHHPIAARTTYELNRLLSDITV
jgi:hypothetical protein